MAMGQKRKRPVADYSTVIGSSKPIAKLHKTSNPVEPLSPSPSASPTNEDTTATTELKTVRRRQEAAGKEEEEEEEEEEEDMTAQLERIAASSRTPFEKRVLSLLCQIPRGHVSTYGLLSAHMGSSPRAVGGALRRNPFAPLGKQNDRPEALF